MINNKQQIEQDVLAAIKADGRISDPELIAVAVDGIGTVVLTGSVASPPQRHAAAKAAHGVEGVYEVIVDDLAVHPPIAHHRSDDAIRAAVVQRLSDDARIHAERLHVKVSDGVVTLTGYVRDHAQRACAADDAEDVAGVVAVANRIEVR